MADLTTLLSNFLKDLYSGTFGVTVPVSKIALGDGTAGAPSYTFASQTGMGLKRAGSGLLDYMAPNYSTTTPIVRLSGAFGVTVGAGGGYLITASGGADATQSQGASASWFGSIATSASATGLTINTAGAVTRSAFKATLSSTHAAYQAAALTADVTLATIPAKSRVIGIIADTTTAWAGTAGTLAFTVGKSAGGNEYVLSHDVKTGVVTKGLADGDLGTALARATAIQGGDLPSWSATTALQCRLTSGTGNLGTGAATNLTQGTTVFYILVECYI